MAKNQNHNKAPSTKKKQLNKRIKNSIKGLLWWFSGWDSKLPMQKMWVQFLVRELGSYKPCSTVRKKKKKKLQLWETTG